MPANVIVIAITDNTNIVMHVLGAKSSGGIHVKIPYDESIDINAKYTSSAIVLVLNCRASTRSVNTIVIINR